MNKNKIGFKLLVITDNRYVEDNILDVIEECCLSGVNAVQFRMNELSVNKQVLLLKKMRTITNKTKTKLIVNQRLDTALLSKADGVHSPSRVGVDAGYLKKYRLLSGRSVHSKEEAIEAENKGFDYVVFGPVFMTPSKKKYGSPQRIGKLKEVCSLVNIPVFAVGGITSKRVKKCLNAGAHGVAVIRAVMESTNIKKTINEFRTELGGL